MPENPNSTTLNKKRYHDSIKNIYGSKYFKTIKECNIIKNYIILINKDINIISDGNDKVFRFCIIHYSIVNDIIQKYELNKSIKTYIKSSIVS